MKLGTMLITKYHNIMYKSETKKKILQKYCCIYGCQKYIQENRAEMVVSPLKQLPVYIYSNVSSLHTLKVFAIYRFIHRCIWSSSYKV